MIPRTLGLAALTATMAAGMATVPTVQPIYNDGTRRPRRPRRRTKRHTQRTDWAQATPVGVIQVRSLRSVGGYSKGQLKRYSYEIGIVAMFARARLQEQQRRRDRRMQRQAAALDQAAKDGVF